MVMCRLGSPSAAEIDVSAVCLVAVGAENVHGDEKRPRCQSCEVRGYVCRWGLKASFHPSRSLRLSSPDREKLLAIENNRRNAKETRVDQLGSSRGTPVSKIINDTEEIVRGYQVDNEATLQSDSDGEPDQELPPAFTTPSHIGNDHPIHLSNASDRTLINNNASHDHEINIESLLFSVQSTNIGRYNGGPEISQDGQSMEQLEASTSAYMLPFSLGQAVSRNASPLPEPSMPVTPTESAKLLSLYLCETGTWCETTDSERHFTIESIHKMLDSKPFMASAIALASRQRDAIHGQQSSMTLELYQYTIQLLLRQDPGTTEVPVLAACTLLCVYEMMASCVWEWRRHLKGCAGLLHNRKWNGSSSGIVKSCFWAFARIDVWAAFISGKTTLIPTVSWVDDGSIQSVAAKGNLDDYCNLTILIFAQIVNLLGDATADDQDNDPAFHSSVDRLWAQLQDWWRLRPKEVCPLLRVGVTGSTPFPTVIFSRPSSICGATFYHAGSILLLRAHCIEPRAMAHSSEMDQIWHARELGGISASNVSHSNYVNQLQPLYIAGTVFAEQRGASISNTRRTSQWASTPSGIDRQVPTTSLDGVEDFALEKIALLKQLARIERDTGWKTSDRAADLRRLWGFG